MIVEPKKVDEGLKSRDEHNAGYDGGDLLDFDQRLFKISTLTNLNEGDDDYDWRYQQTRQRGKVFDVVHKHSCQSV